MRRGYGTVSQAPATTKTASSSPSGSVGLGTTASVGPSMRGSARPGIESGPVAITTAWPLAGVTPTGTPARFAAWMTACLRQSPS